MKKLVFVSSFVAMFALSFAACDSKKAAAENEATEVVADSLAVEEAEAVADTLVADEAEAVVAE